MIYVKSLTPTEERLFLYFLDHENELLSRKDILKDVWEMEDIDSRVADCYVGYLKKKVKGYRFVGIKKKGYICVKDAMNLKHYIITYKDTHTKVYHTFAQNQKEALDNLFRNHLDVEVLTIEEVEE